MVKLIPNRQCPGQQDFRSELDEAPRVPVLLFRTCVTAATPDQLQARPVGHTDSLICTFHMLREGRELCSTAWVVYSHRHNCTTAFPHRSQPHSPAPAQSDWSPSRPHSCHTGFSSHHILELTPWWKGQKAHQWNPPVTGMWHSAPHTAAPVPGTLRMWPWLAHGCGYSGKPPTPSHSADQREGNSLCTLPG